MPAGPVYIEKEAFYGCQGLKTLSLPESLIEISSGALEFSPITDDTIPANME